MLPGQGGKHLRVSVLALQVWFANWVTTYGEAVVRVPQRAFTWAQQGLLGRDVTFVVRSTCPPRHHTLPRWRKPHPHPSPWLNRARNSLVASFALA